MPSQKARYVCDSRRERHGPPRIGVRARKGRRSRGKRIPEAHDIDIEACMPHRVNEPLLLLICWIDCGQSHVHSRSRPIFLKAATVEAPPQRIVSRGDAQFVSTELGYSLPRVKEGGGVHKRHVARDVRGRCHAAFSVYRAAYHRVFLRDG